MRWTELPPCLLLLTWSVAAEGASYSNVTKSAYSANATGPSASATIKTFTGGGSSTSSGISTGYITSSSGIASYILAGINGMSNVLAASGSTSTLPRGSTPAASSLASINGTSVSASTLNGTVGLLNPSAATSSAALPNVTIAPTGSGYAYASNCNQLLLSWSAESEAARSVYTVASTQTTTDVESEWVYSTSTEAVTTTLCDGVPRVLGGETVYGNSSFLTTYTSDVFTETAFAMTANNYTARVPKPDCTIDEQDCKSLYTTWSVGYTSPWTVSLPACDYETFVSSCTECCASCTISANGVQMMYWPPTAIGSYCAANRTYVTGTPTKPGFPNTKIIGNTTYTSPTVYLGFTYVAAPYGEAGYCGNVISTTVIPMAPESVSSVRFKTLTNCTTCHEGPNTYTIDSVYPVNYADFVGPIPVAAYQGQAGCIYGGCETISDASYSPFLSVPAELRSAEAVWNSCVLFVDGIWDPPIALQQAGTLAGVTTPVASSTSATTSATAEPVSTLKSPIPSSTAASTSGSTSIPSPGPVKLTQQSSVAIPIETPTAYESSTGTESPNVDSQTSVAGTSVQASGSSTIPSSVISTQQSSVATATETPTAYESSTDASQSAEVTSHSTGSGVQTGGSQQTSPQVSGGTETVDSHTSAAPDPGTSAASTVAVVSLGSSSATAVVSSGQVIIGSDTVPAGQASTISGHLVSAASDAVVLDGTTYQASAAASAAIQTVAVVPLGSSSATVLISSGQVIIGSNTVSVGQVTTISGHQVSAASNAVVVDDTTHQASAVASSTAPENALSVLSAAETSDAGNLGQGSSQEIGATSATETSNSQAFPVSQVVVTVGGTTYSLVQSGGVASIATFALTVGGSPTTVGSQVISLASAGVIVGSSTVPLTAVTATGSQGGQTSQAVITIGSSLQTAVLQSSTVQVGSQALTVGSPAVTVSGETFSAGASGIVQAASGSTQTVLYSAMQAAHDTQGEVTEASSFATLVANGQTITAYETSGGVVLAGVGSTTTIASGAVVSFAGQTFSAAGSEVIVDGSSTVALSVDPQPTVSQAIFTVGGQTLTAIPSSGSVILEDSSSTVTLGETGLATYQGQAISALASDGGIVADGESTILFSSTPSPTTNGGSEAAFTAGSQTLIVLASSGDPYVVIEDSSSTFTLSDGAAATYESHVISVLPSGQGVVVDGASTVALTSVLSSLQPTSTAEEAVFTVSGQTFTAIHSDDDIILVDPSTTIFIPDGGETVVEGQSIRAGSSGGVVVVDGSVTETLSIPASSTTSTAPSSSTESGGGGGNSATKSVSAASNPAHTDKWASSALVMAVTVCMLTMLL